MTVELNSGVLEFLTEQLQFARLTLIRGHAHSQTDATHKGFSQKWENLKAALPRSTSRGRISVASTNLESDASDGNRFDESHLEPG